MNGLTIIQTTQGLAKYLEEQFGPEAKQQTLSVTMLITLLVITDR